jgi:hypothetical protein
MAARWPVPLTTTPRRISVRVAAVAPSSTRRTATGRPSRTTRPSLSSIWRTIVGFIR